MTYDAILERMRAAYEAEAGFRPEDGGDAGIRLRVFAAEMMNAYRALDAMREDAFPDTAAGAALEEHAAQRGLSRRPAERSTGELVFSRETPLAYDVEIPAGTVCAASAAVEFETTAAAVLAAGSLSVTAPARAVEPGRGGNAAVGAVNTLVTPPSGVERVTNAVPFTGGTDAESDDSLRERLLAACAVLPNGVNTETYRRAALAVDGVMSAGAVARVSGIGTVGVYVWGKDGPVSEKTLAEVTARLNALREICVDVTAANAAPVVRRAALYIEPKAGVSFDEAEALCTEAVERYFLSLTVGSKFTRAALIAAAMGTGTLLNCTVPSSIADYETLPGEIVTAGAVTVLPAGEEGDE